LIPNYFYDCSISSLGDFIFIVLVFLNADVPAVLGLPLGLKAPNFNVLPLFSLLDYKLLGEITPLALGNIFLIYV